MNKHLIKKENKRQSNLEVLRIVAMVMIIILHMLGRGGVLQKVEYGTFNYYLTWILESISYIAVNLYVLISGYFLIDSKFKLSKFVKLISQVLFYSIGIYFMFILYERINFSLESFIEACLPLESNAYWFVSIYAMLYIVSPYLNILIKNMDRKAHKRVIIVSIIFGCFINVIAKIISDGRFNIIGTSLVWFVFLYMIAAYIKKYSISLSNKKCILIYIISLITMVLSKLIPQYLYIKKNILIMDKVSNVFFNYSSILVLLMSISVFLIFKNIKIKNNILNKIILFLSPLTFGVYLIHDNGYIRILLWEYFKSYKIIDKSYFIIRAIITIFVIFLGCSLIEYIRKVLFDKLKIDSILNKFSDKIQNFACKYI